MTKTSPTLSLGAACALLLGCAGSLEDDTRASLDALARDHGYGGPEDEAEPTPPDGTLASYVAYAMAASPELRADFERYRAAVARIRPARRLPEPQVSFAAFVRAVETRVGPQRARLGVRQAIPWPGRLRAASEAAAARARVEEARFAATALSLRQEVAEAYWSLWLVHRSHGLASEQEAVHESLVETIRGRVETGQATLADLALAELALARHRDHHDAHQEAMAAMSARLRAVIGAPPDLPTPVDPAPPPEVPVDLDEAALRERALAHPRLEALERMALASEAMAEAEEEARYPAFAVGADWIVTGEARADGVPGSGKDPVIVGVTVSLPLWGGSYRDSARAARAEAAAQRAEGEALRRRIEALVARSLSSVRDAHRRERLHATTLVPQAETAFTSNLGGYQVGRASVAALLMSHRELLSLELDRLRAEAELATAWAALEAAVGEELADTQEVDHD